LGLECRARKMKPVERYFKTKPSQLMMTEEMKENAKLVIIQTPRDMSIITIMLMPLE
jgi:hypothetical protein